MHRNILPRVRHTEPLRLLTGDCTANVSLRLASPIIRLLDGLLSGQECDDLVALAVPRLQRHFFDALRDSLKKIHHSLFSLRGVRYPKEQLDKAIQKSILSLPKLGEAGILESAN